MDYVNSITELGNGKTTVWKTQTKSLFLFEDDSVKTVVFNKMSFRLDMVEEGL